MQNQKKTGLSVLHDILFTATVLTTIYFGNQFLQELYQTPMLAPMLFVLGVFIISLRTQGYIFSISASLISVFAVNYAFTTPYYAIDLITPECIVAAVVMFIVAIATCTLTNKVKAQEKMKAESEMERMRANLLRAVSHDLRTPLTSIYGSCSAILENYDVLTREQQFQLLGDVQEDSEWLIRMVENLLLVTRIDSEQVKLSKMPTVLEELVDAVLVKFSKHCPQQQVNVSIPDGFIMIPMDAMLIEQVLINILENAVHHAKGMTELNLSVEIQGKTARFEVRDNGCGIPESKMSTLFTGTASQDASSPADSTRNMGIGLSVCSAIIRAHSGHIWAENLPEGGAAFYFTLDAEDMNE